MSPKKVVLTPEERVRQSVVSYFRWILRTPLRYMQTEVSMKRYGYTSRKDRADLLILRPDGNTILAVIECKAAHVEISEEVIGQMLRYAKALNTEYAFATNGHDFFAYGFQRKKGIFRWSVRALTEKCVCLVRILFRSLRQSVCAPICIN